MLRVTLTLSLIFDTYRLGFWSWPQVLEFGPIGQAQVIGKTLTKAEVYRACFKDFLLNAQHSDKCEALGRALTSQEFRYFKQAYYTAHKHTPWEGLAQRLSSPFVSNFSRVRKAYEEALQARRANCPSC